MGKPVNSKAKRVETTTLNQKINRKVFNAFKDYCKELGYPMNIVIETFMRQYSNDRFTINENDINKWKVDESELDILSTSFNKEIYSNFKYVCKEKGHFVKYVITAFMEIIITREFILEYTKIPNENKD